MEMQTFYVGASKIEIKYPENFFPYSSFRRRYFTGAHDDLHVRCIMIKNRTDKALIVSIEVGDLGEIEKWKERIQGITEIPKDNIFLTVTHTHPAPHISDDWNQEIEDKDKTIEFGECVWVAMKKAILDAEKKLQPAKISYGTGQCDINVSRDLPDREHVIVKNCPHNFSDKSVEVVRFDNMNDEPIAIFINYCVHGSIMMEVAIKDGGMLVSSDLPGWTSKMVEDAYGGDVVALWTSGAAGDQDPKYPGMRFNHGAEGKSRYSFDAGEAGYILLQVQAESLADEVLYVCDGLQGTGKSETGLFTIQKDYTAREKKVVHGPAESAKNVQYEDAGELNLHMSVMVIGRTAMIGIPGELVCKVGAQIKDELKSRFDQVIIVTHCNGSMSYMSDIAGFDHHTSEAARSHLSRGWAEKIFIPGAIELTDSLFGYYGEK